LGGLPLVVAGGCQDQDGEQVIDVQNRRKARRPTQGDAVTAEYVSTSPAHPDYMAAGT